LNALTRHLKQIRTYLPLLEGGKHSLAASLDYALNKQPEWLFDMFGSDQAGNTYLRKLLLRSNSGRRRRGPVSLSINEENLHPGSIRVYVEGVLVQDEDKLQRLAWAIASGEQNVIAPQITDSNAISDRSSSIASDDWKSGDLSSLIVPVTDKDIDDIFEYEEGEFPGSHATKERLREWSQHDPQSFMCIKDADGSFMAYYILFFIKREALSSFLIGGLLEDDVISSDLIEPDPANYSKQEALHVCCFAARWHASMFTVDLVWHLIGRILHLAVTGSLSRIYAEAATANGQAFLKRFGFKRVYPDRAQGDPLFELRLTSTVLHEWEYRYKFRTFCRGVDAKNEPLQTLAAIL
jgi:hypothetical protein